MYITDKVTVQLASVGLSQACPSIYKNVRYLPAFYCKQLHVHMVNCDWLEETFQTKAEWRSVSTICGVLCVMAPGEVLMLL